MRYIFYMICLLTLLYANINLNSNDTNDVGNAKPIFKDTSSIKKYELEEYLDDAFVNRPVKSIIVKRYDLININGKIIIDSNNVSTNIYIYNNNALLIQLSYFYNENFFGSYKYTYDDNGNRLTEVRYDKNSIKYISELSEYDDKNNLISWKSISQDGVVKTKQRWIYNANNQLIEEIIGNTNTDGFKIKYSYDSVGNKVEQTYYDFDDNKERVHKYLYNDNNQWVSSKIYNEVDSLIYQEDYEYDNNGKLILEPFHVIIGKAINHRVPITDGILPDRYYASIYNKNKFDDKGRLVELIFKPNRIITTKGDTLGGDIVEKKRLKYDKYDNWIEIDDYHKDTIISKTVREINYYDYNF